MERLISYNLVAFVALLGCDPTPAVEGPTEHCGDLTFANDNVTLCFGGCKDPATRATPACAPCVGAGDDPLCGGGATTGTGTGTDTGTSTGTQTETETEVDTGGDTDGDTETDGGSTGTTGAGPTCGDDMLDAGEECDDGNNVDGDGCEADCSLPTAVVAIDEISSGSGVTCARAGDRVKCFGVPGAVTGSEPLMGGDMTPAAIDVPELDIGGTVEQLSAGFFHACALLDTSEVTCWGSGFVGNLGYGNTEDIGDDETPASAGTVSVGGAVDQVSAGGAHTCALLSDGTVRCWGSNIVGTLGLGFTDDIGDDELPSVVEPVDIGGTAIAIGTGIDLSCALLDDGTVRCWGLNTYGNLGLGHTTTIGDDEVPSSVPVVDIGGTVEELAVCGQGACVRLDTGGVRCWGRNEDGQAGYASSEPGIGDDESPASMGDVAIGGTAVQLSCAEWATCVRLDTDEVKCWGRGESGQLGQGDVDTIGDDETPAAIDPIDVGGAVSHIDAGRDFACARVTNGAARCWGDALLIGRGDMEDLGDDEAVATLGDLEIFAPR